MGPYSQKRFQLLEIDLVHPMTDSDKLITRLTEIFGADGVLYSAEELLVYECDG